MTQISLDSSEKEKYLTYGLPFAHWVLVQMKKCTDLWAPITMGEHKRSPQYDKLSSSCMSTKTEKNAIVESRYSMMLASVSHAYYVRAVVDDESCQED